MSWSRAYLSSLLDYKIYEGRDHVPPSVTVHTLRFHTAPGLHQKISKCSSRDLRRRRLYSVEDTAWRRPKWGVQLPKVGRRGCRRAWGDTAQPLSGEPLAPLPPRRQQRQLAGAPVPVVGDFMVNSWLPTYVPKTDSRGKEAYVPRKWNHF